MKKLISILLALIMLMALAVLAMALDVRGTVELGSGSYDGIFVQRNAHLIVNGDVKINAYDGLVLHDGAKLTVNSGCSLTGENVSFDSHYSIKIEIAEGGRIEMTFNRGIDAFISVLTDSGIYAKREGNTITAPCSKEEACNFSDEHVDYAYYRIRSVSSGKFFDVAGGNDVSNYKDGTAIESWSANNQENQIFKITKIDDNGKVWIMPKYEGNGTFYVSAYGGATLCAKLKLGGDGNSSASQWVLEEQGNGKYKIKSASNLGLAVVEADSEFVLLPINYATLFELEKVGDPTGSTVSEGNTAIVAAVGAVAVICAAVVIAKKKKAAKTED